MPAGAALPGRSPPASPEIVHTSERTRIVRLALAGRTVVRKQPLGPDAQERVHHEVGMLRLLRGVPGVVQLVDTAQDQEPILMEDAGRLTLSELEKPLPVDGLTGLAVQLAHAVAGMHGRGVLHHDIAPANVVLTPSGAPYLVDFALATASAELRPEFTHPSEIVGTLPYLAPERTGRTGRPVDQRADLYALGATLYELATGAPPFGTGDPLRLMHDHLARVPVAPAESNPAVPAPLSDIVMHLLEKEPDERYQSAEGLLYDLEQLRAAPGRRGPAPVRVGERDVRPRLLAPARLVARDDEVATLREAFEQALLGHCRAVLVAGAPGVGKTVLVDELRSAVTGVDGWFVAGKFDQYRRDLESDAIYQAFRALGRLMLAEPEAQLGEVRERILRALGPNAAEATSAIPEFKTLLGVPPEPGDPLTAQARAQRNAVQLIRAIASRKRPVVVFLDDLQWAGRTPLGFVDLVLSDEVVEDFLLVAAYREGDVDAAHPLAAVLSRSRDEPEVRRLRLRNLAVPSVVTMVAEMLQVDGGAVAGLVDLIAPHTSGNPYETVELLNGLRRDGLLTLTAAGWRWDDAAVRAHVGRSEAAGLPAAGLEALAPAARRLAEEMACLGGRAELNLLQVATAEPASIVERLLAPILDEGILVLEPGANPAVRFRHDRIRETILGDLGPARRRAVHLKMARRLAAVPELSAVAAEQYLPVVDAIGEPAERRQVVGLLRRAADQAALIGDHRLLNALMEAALGLVDPDDVATLVELRTARHSALYGMARLEEADEEYRAVEALSTTSLQRADATVVHLRSMTQQGRLHEVLELGLASLRELGIAVPAADRIPGELDRQFDFLHRWLDSADDSRELADPTLLAATRLINATLPAAYFAAQLPTVAWLGLEGVRIWLDRGPGRTLLGPASHAAVAAAALRGDYAAGHRAFQRILALGEARGYEPDTSQARFLFACSYCWFEPVEKSVEAGRQARRGLLAGGDVANAGYTYHVTVEGLLYCAPSLDEWLAEVEAGLAFVHRAGGERSGPWLDPYQWLGRVLRGESSGEPTALDRYADSPPGLMHVRITRAIAAAIFGDADDLVRHTAAAMPLLPAFRSTYPTATMYLLRGLALAVQARTAEGDERDGLLSELDEATRWLAERAADAPDNFLHLVRLLEAEQAWVTGDFRAAVLAFDAARREASLRQRPWHRALIAERAARFRFAYGNDHAAYEFLAQARHEYLAWGATAKVDQLDWAFPPLRTQPDATFDQPADRRSTVTTGTIDLLGILSASRALSSETSVERLHGRVVDVLGSMTGATGVHLALWSDERLQWMLPAPGRAGGRAPIGVAGDASAVPMSVLRYVQRTGEPLIVNDAAGDDRFARDPYFTAAAVCSLLAVPILSRGALRAVLLLENRLVRGAFTTDRLESVKLVAGQLAVSLDNAQLYAEWHRIADEQAALRRVATLVAQGSSPTAVFDAVAGEIERLLEADGVALARYEPGERAVVVAHRGAHESKAPSGTRVSHAGSQDGVAELGRTLGMRASTGAPIVVDGRPWGIAIAAWPRDEAAPPDAEERMGQFARLLETAIANADSRDQLTASRARLLTEADAARRRVVRDLHDGAQQRLVHTVITLEMARQAVHEGDEHAEALVAEAVEYAQQANRGLRELAHGIVPADLASAGLRGAVASMVERLDLPVRVDLCPERFAAEVEANAYFIVAEALTNIVKHARAGSAAVTATIEDGELRVEVRDDGVGGADPGGHGLIGVEDRATALGGRFTLQSPPGGGTVLTVALPVSG